MVHRRRLIAFLFIGLSLALASCGAAATHFHPTPLPTVPTFAQVGGIRLHFSATCPVVTPQCDVGSQLTSALRAIALRTLSADNGVVAQAKQDAAAPAGQYGIIVEVPGLRDSKPIVAALTLPGYLQFLDTQGAPVPVGTMITPGQYPVLFTQSDLDTNVLAISLDAAGHQQITFAMNPNAQPRFADYTANNIGKYLTVTLDGNVVESAIIESQITGEGNLSGPWTADEMSLIILVLKSGAIPLQLSYTSEESVPPQSGG